MRKYNRRNLFDLNEDLTYKQQINRTLLYSDVASVSYYVSRVMEKASEVRFRGNITG